MEKIQKLPLPIIGTDHFGLTEKEVELALKEAQKDLKETRESIVI